MPPRIPRAGARPALAASWTCRLSRRTIAASAAAPADKPYYVTTPIFYVNAAPHVGHLSTMVLADIIKRWQLLQGRTAMLSTGTDEHGLKIQQASAKAGSEPLPFCDKGADVFKNLAAKGLISNDHFVRTTDQAHKDAVQYAWHLLKERGYIYSSKHEGWYSVSDETYYPTSGVHLIVEPATGRKIMASIETGKEVEWTTEINYHFRLSAFKDQLLHFYRENPGWIIPQFRMDDVVQAVSSGLEDLSVSRPTSRLTWGVPVPGDDSQTIYVWLDALLNYATKIGYPWPPGKMQSSGWPADCHVIGKDITRFHCIYWPAFLMALSLPLPKRILTTAHWTMNSQKMSKSVGNVVNPFFALDRFGADAMRYYLAHDGGISQDANYSNYYVVERYKKGLQGGLGNLASRIVKGKGWDVRRAVASGAQNIPRRATEQQAKARAHFDLLTHLPGAVEQKLQALDVSGGLKTIMEAVYETNRYLQEAAPWNHVPKAQQEIHAAEQSAPAVLEKHRPNVDRTIFLCAETLRIAAILLQPYMPGKSAELLDMLGVNEDKRSFEFAEVCKDLDYGTSKVDLKKTVLFPRIGIDELD
ncbi:Aminoacyl-tRNA synthetase class 1a Anticodon-binding protein [Lasiodiplodia theobromae]|uniref:Probable methionine--tRNA ligase, mitochondrial n=1 Tax=Lasiodiplodia theobromae TaxID=45133 RepID=A0A5N5CXP8_9PEZI|nr:Aminoacyl-tRNA synthetase class 1a Anticodon-binding protein [Lasiodiplodia theobromae]KAB2570076.1 putative methionine--tRNA ligase [Lasiodiplodia theobromae]KAF4536745.1 Aminoacyl-tRNA synthetase class 1a Anticodon-binding protein [Lasiodiplodia theobromae]KAF9640518.1 Aminoacyl-tRNA synthetase class 1a Anticodon-binding protein [Lasiodiplodia theobromae]